MGGNYNKMLRKQFYVPVTTGVLAVVLWVIGYALATSVPTHGDFLVAWFSGVSASVTIAALIATAVSVVSAIMQGYDLV